MATISFQARQYPALPGETLLDTLLRHGAPVAYSCRKGSCGCCQLRVVDGQVEQAQASGVAAQDHVLACVCRPAGDVVLAPADLSQQPVDAEHQQSETDGYGDVAQKGWIVGIECPGVGRHRETSSLTPTG